MMMANMSMTLQNIGNQIQFMGNQMVGMGMQLRNACFGMQNLDELIQNMTIQILNIGTQMINICMQYQNMNKNFNNEIQIQNFFSQIQNMAQQMTTMEFPNYNQLNLENKMNKEQINMRNYPKINIIFFNNIDGIRLNLITDYGTTIDQLLKNYMIKIGRPELINSKNIWITLNSEKKLMFGDNTTVQKFVGISEKSVYTLNVYVNRLE